MVGDGDRIWPARLGRVLVVAAIGLSIFVVMIALTRTYRARLKARRDAAASEAMLQQASELETLNALPEQSEKPLDPVLKVAGNALENFRATVFDYTARLEKQERIGGQLLDPQEIEIKVITRSPRPGSATPNPFHVYFHFVSPESVRGREVIWVEGKNDGNLVAHEAGTLGFMRVRLPPDGVMAMMGNKYPASQVGIENLLRKLIEKGLRDRDVESTSVEINEDITWEGIRCTQIIVIHPQQETGLDFHRAEIIIDPARQIPLSYASYLWPTAESAEPPLEERYIYHDIKLNVGLSESDFDPDNENYNFP